MFMKDKKKMPKCICNKAETLDTFQEFGDVTTLHGIRYITEPRANICERVCWTLAILTSTVFCAIEISKLHARWMESPVITSPAPKSTSVTDIPFPAVTICPESKVLRSKFDVLANLESLVKSLEDENSTDTLAQTVSLLCDSDPALPSKFKPTIEHLKMIPEISPRLDDVFEKCSFHYADLHCSEIFRPILTDFGRCFTFNMLSNKDMFKDTIDSSKLENDERYIDKISTWSLKNGYKQTRISSAKASLLGDEYPRHERRYLGIPSGLKVTLKSKIGTSQQICSESSSDNFRVSVHAPMKFPSPGRKYFHVSPESQVMVAVRPLKTDANMELHTSRYTSEMRGCVFPEDSTLLVLKHHTRQNCMIDTIARKVYEECNCTLLFMPIKGNNTDSTVDFCSPSNIKQCNKDFNIWKCLPSCYKLKYIYNLSASKYEPAKPRDNTTSNYQYSKLVVFFEESSFFVTKKTEMYGITDFIANCGGLLGLFSGFSLITAMEICYFAFMRSICKKRRNHLNGVGTEEQLCDV